jgi:uncharacterized membrane protein
MYIAEASIRVDADQQTSWAYVSNYQNFDKWMSDIVEIKPLGGDESEWHMSGPLGIPVSWKAVTSSMEPPKHLAWHSLEGLITTKGFIKVEPDGSGSKVTVHIEYAPPGGALGEAFATIFKNPQKMLENGLEDLSENLSMGREDAAGKKQTRLEESTQSSEGAGRRSM